VKKSLVISAYVTPTWIGGIYYRKNILFSLLQNKALLKEYRIIVLANVDVAKHFDNITGDFLLIRDNINNKLMKKLFKCYITLRHNVKYIFPANVKSNSKKFGPKLLYWIADFQHYHYPQFFTEGDLYNRASNEKIIAESACPLVLSSMDAKSDFIKKYNKNSDEIFVVPFVSYIEPEIKECDEVTENAILKKYDLNKKRYVCISNQFWQHKNHIVVLKAMKLFKKKYPGSELIFVFTGQLKDYRNPEYYNRLCKLIYDYSIKSNIKILGFISRIEQIVIMKNSKFIIQASLFEGWGTVLEDAKVLDKHVILSDIPVHREQMNEKCKLFNPNSEEDLCDIITNMVNADYFSDTQMGLKKMYENAYNYSKAFEKILK
jgi:glycosyltransferase involved in cell wall biosynthesis